MSQDVDREVLTRLPLAEATLQLWAWVADDPHLDDLFQRLRGGRGGQRRGWATRGRSSGYRTPARGGPPTMASRCVRDSPMPVPWRNGTPANGWPPSNPPPWRHAGRREPAWNARGRRFSGRGRCGGSGRRWRWSGPPGSTRRASRRSGWWRAELERRGEEARKQQQRQLDDEYDRFVRSVPAELSDKALSAIRALASDLPAGWAAATPTPADRPRIARRLLQRVVVIADKTRERVAVTRHGVGGTGRSHPHPRPVTRYSQQSDYPRLVARLRPLWSGRDNAATFAQPLNAEEFCPPKRTSRFRGERVRRWTTPRELARRQRHGSTTGRGSDEDRPMGLARRLGIHRDRGRRWMRVGGLNLRRDEDGHQVIGADASELRRRRERHALPQTWANKKRLAKRKKPKPRPPRQTRSGPVAGRLGHAPHLRRQHGWQIELLFEQGNGEVGLNHCEVRSWRGWQHHVTLTLLALWFLQTERLRVGEKNPPLTVPQGRQMFAELLHPRPASATEVAEKVSAVLRCNEEARIYHWYSFWMSDQRPVCVTGIERRPG